MNKGIGTLINNIIDFLVEVPPAVATPPYSTSLSLKPSQFPFLDSPLHVFRKIREFISSSQTYPTFSNPNLHLFPIFHWLPYPWTIWRFVFSIIFGPSTFPCFQYPILRCRRGHRLHWLWMESFTKPNHIIG